MSTRATATENRAVAITPVRRLCTWPCRYARVILKKLVAKGAKVNDICDDNTPLTLAAMANNEMTTGRISIPPFRRCGHRYREAVQRRHRRPACYKGDMKKYLEDTKKKYDIAEAARGRRTATWKRSVQRSLRPPGKAGRGRRNRPIDRRHPRCDPGKEASAPCAQRPIIKLSFRLFCL